MPKLKELAGSGIGGIIPMIAANAGDDAGFALGMVPGLAYKDRKRKEAEAAGASAGMKKGGKVSSASSRADGCAIRGKTRGKMV